MGSVPHKTLSLLEICCVYIYSVYIYNYIHTYNIIYICIIIWVFISGGTPTYGWFRMEHPI